MKWPSFWLADQAYLLGEGRQDEGAGGVVGEDARRRAPGGGELLFGEGSEVGAHDRERMVARMGRAVCEQGERF